MTNEREYSDLSEFMQYLARESCDDGKLPSLAVLSKELKISIASLREQLGVARALGFVEVRPKTGIRRKTYSFSPAVTKSLAYATTIDPVAYFRSFADLRNHIEAAYWHQAVCQLTEEDHLRLIALIDQAFEKLNGHPIQIPHNEHKELHLSIYSHLDNPFVTGLLEAYWEAYEAVGLNLYADLDYMRTVWEYHQRMVDAIRNGDAAGGYQLLIEHTNLLQRRTKPASRPIPAKLGFE